MNEARADALAARSHLATHGWIARSSEPFRHLPPPEADLWLGEPTDAGAPLRSGWQLQATAGGASVAASWLDATEPAHRGELLAGLALPGDEPAAPFAWAHRALVRDGLRVRIEPHAAGPVVLRVQRTAADAVEAPLLVIELAPGARCVLAEVHERAPRPNAIVQNLQVHVRLGAGAALTHLRAVLPEARDSIAHHVGVRLEGDAAYEHALLAAGSGYHLQRMSVEMQRPGASARSGAVLLASGSALDHQVEARHAAAATRSSIDMLALGAGSARIVANALSTIAPGCDDAATRQRLAGVPTAGQPRLVLRPHLEINHDQVQAAHGATWGALPQEALFLARQRGLGESAAKALIAQGMADAVFARAVPDASVLAASGLETLLARAVRAHLDGQEVRHG